MLKAKRILIAAGGTGGHINPALSVAGYIRSQDPTAEILFVGTADKMEAKLVPQAGYPIKMIDISGFRRDLSPAGIVHNIKTVSKMFKSSSQAKKIIEDFKPELATMSADPLSEWRRSSACRPLSTSRTPIPA